MGPNASEFTQAPLAGFADIVRLVRADPFGHYVSRVNISELY